MYQVLLSTLIFAGYCLAQPTISLSLPSGPPTLKLSVSGSAFSANAAIGIYFDTALMAMADTDGSGAFNNVGIQVPAGALPGQHSVSAQQTTSGDSAQTPFNVNTNWSQFHFGADHQGYNRYENVLNTSTVRSLSLAWKYNTKGPIFSSPAVAKGIVYIGSRDKYLYALDAKTGAKRWRYATGGQINTAPAVADGIVYVGADKLYALKSGQLLWSYATGVTTPVVSGGTVYAGNGILSALDATSGALRWSFAVGSAGFGSVSSPVVANGIVYFAGGGSYLLALSASDGTLLWHRIAPSDSGSWSQASPAVVNGVVYAGDVNGGFQAMDATTGAPLWTYLSGASGNGEYSALSSPAVANGVIYVMGASYLHALKASTGEVLWKGLGAQSYSPTSPVVANGVVYACCLYAIDAQTGTYLWSYPVPAAASSPAVVNGMVYAGSIDGNVYAFGLPSGGPSNSPPGN